MLENMYCDSRVEFRYRTSMMTWKVMINWRLMMLNKNVRSKRHFQCLQILGVAVIGRKSQAQRLLIRAYQVNK